MLPSAATGLGDNGAMEIKITSLGKGLHPSEEVIEIDAKDGKERLVIDSNALNGTYLGVGYPLSSNNNGHVFVELPRETFSGVWRLWVAKELTRNEEKVA